ncbi:MAG: type IV secretion system DNA-binding domain-containing protein [Acidobacteriota bacterium]
MTDIARNVQEAKQELGVGRRVTAGGLARSVGYGLGAALPAAAMLSPAMPATHAATLAVAAASGALLGLGLGATRLPVVRGKGTTAIDPSGADGLVMGLKEDGTAFVWPRHEQVWHGLIVGKPGSGKTVQMKSLAFQAMAQGAGVLFLDAKPSQRNLQELHWMVRRVGREDDFRVLLPGQPDLSHSFNPLEWGSVESQVSLLTGLSRFGSNSSTEFYHNRQGELVGGVLAVLQRRKERLGQHYHLGDVLAGLAVREAREDLATSGKPCEARSQLAAALATYQGDRGFDEKRYYHEASGLTSILGQYVWSTSGRILLCERGEIDLYDVVRNGRILYVSIPTASAEKSAWSWALLVLKGMMAVVGRLIHEGHRPRVPFLALLDELRAYMTEELALAFAQWREANVSVVGGLQSISQMKGTEELDAQILDNTGFKQFFAAAGYDGAEAAATQLGKSMQLLRQVSLGESSGTSGRAMDVASSSRGRSQSFGGKETYHYQVLPEDVMALPVGMAYHKWGGGHALLRTPLLQVPDAELVDVQPTRFAVKADGAAGLYKKHLRHRRATPGLEEWTEGDDAAA